MHVCKTCLHIFIYLIIRIFLGALFKVGWKFDRFGSKIPFQFFSALTGWADMCFPSACIFLRIERCADKPNLKQSNNLLKIQWYFWYPQTHECSVMENTFLTNWISHYFHFVYHVLLTIAEASVAICDPHEKPWKAAEKPKGSLCMALQETRKPFRSLHIAFQKPFWSHDETIGKLSEIFESP